MKLWPTFALMLAFLPSTWATIPAKKDIVEEVLYQDFKQSLLSHAKSSSKLLTGFSKFEQKLFVDAVEDIIEDGESDESDLINNFNEINTIHYGLVERLRLGILRIKYKKTKALTDDLLNELTQTLLGEKVETRLIYTLAAYETELLEANHSDIIALAKKHPQYFDIAEDQEKKDKITTDLVADLFHKSPDVTTYMNGEYVKSVKIFMFCRENRLYPCLMTMRNVHGEIIRNADGTIWSNPALASSAKGLPSYTRNGNTPAGILTIDSVMPTADQNISFGKFRRMILNFIPKSKGETLLKSLLPESSLTHDWWKPSIVARDIGRNLLRIHGTGKINQDPTTPYFPFMRTSGCIAQRENIYSGVEFQDQRELLDDVMVAMDMEPAFENEVKVKGLLYLIDIDDVNAPVDLADLAQRGIE